MKNKEKTIKISITDFIKVINKNGCYKFPNGDKSYWVNGKLHREDGPAVHYRNGYKSYWVNGNLHREGGPAIIHSINGNQYYYINGKLHREDGPAVRWNGFFEYWINNYRFTYQEFILKQKKYINSLNKIIDNNIIIKELLTQDTKESELVLHDYLLENYSEDIKKVKKDISILKFIKESENTTSSS